MTARLLLAAAALAGASCSSQIVCGKGTEPKNDPMTGQVVCTSNGVAQMEVTCDPSSATIVGGICVGDPNKFPHCGPGTVLDEQTMECKSTGPLEPCKQLSSCPAKMGKFAVHGFVLHLADGKCSVKEPVEVRGYDPLAFLSNPAGTMPLQVTTVGDDGSYCLDSLTSGTGLVAIAVTDTNGGTTYMLGGVGLNNVAPGGSYRADAYLVERSLVATWDTQAGLSPGTLENSGVYFARFLDKPAVNGDDSAAMPLPGVKLLMNSMPAPGTFYFKGDLMTIDKSATMTDATGAALQNVPAMPPPPNTYGAMGANITWESAPGGSTKDVVFVNKFHPMM